MDKFPLTWNGKSIGELTTERESLYTWFSARCRLPGSGFWCVWAVGEKGELRIGILEPVGDRAAIRRRFSDRMTAPLGRLLRGEVRPAGETPEAWEAAPQPDALFRSPWLRRLLQGAHGVLARKEEGRQYVALPYDAKAPFPLTTLFCLARVRDIRGHVYVIYCFDETEWPVFH